MYVYMLHLRIENSCGTKTTFRLNFCDLKIYEAINKSPRKKKKKSWLLLCSCCCGFLPIKHERQAECEVYTNGPKMSRWERQLGRTWRQLITTWVWPQGWTWSLGVNTLYSTGSNFTLGDQDLPWGTKFSRRGQHHPWMSKFAKVLIIQCSYKILFDHLPITIEGQGHFEEKGQFVQII
jgi:hypothetical protein